MADRPVPDPWVSLELSGALLLQLDRDGRVVFMNRAAEQVMGWTLEDLSGANAFERWLPANAVREVRYAFDALISGGEAAFEQYENRVRTKSGEERVVAWRTRVLRDDRGEVTGLLTAGFDLTQVRITERALSRSLKELEDIRFALDASAIVAMTDRAGKITFANERFCEISKYPREELLGQTHRLVNSGVHPTSFFEEMWRTIGSGRVWRGDLCNRAKDGTTYWVATTIVPFLDERGVPYQYLAIRHEITERKLMEVELRTANQRIREEQAKLIQAEKLSSIGILASGVAHEINNPLSGVLACVKALRDQNMAGSRREEYFETVLDGLERIQLTVKSLLDYSRQRPPSPVNLEVGELVAACLRLIAPPVRKKNITVESDIQPLDLTVFADRSQMLQALLNVLLNAIYASPENTTVRVDASVVGPRVDLRVRDQGPGIPREILSRVCDPFFTTKPEGEGTGLGLSVTLSIVHANGGDLEIESQLGEGTCVHLWLPRERRVHA